MKNRYLFLGGFILSIGVISYYDIKYCHEPPSPPRLITAGITYGMLDIFSYVDPDLAGVMAVGLALAMMVTRAKSKGPKSCGPDCNNYVQSADMTVIPGAPQPILA